MLIDDVEHMIRSTPGLTATKLAEKLFGIHGHHARVSAECRMLAYFGRAERRGSGGPGDPFRYYPIREDADQARLEDQDDDPPASDPDPEQQRQCANDPGEGAQAQCSAARGVANR